MLRISGSALLGLLCFAASGCESESGQGQCVAGLSGCPCDPTGGCGVGLVCAGGTCVPQGGGSDTGDDGSTGMGGEPGAPEVITLTADPPTIGPGQSVMITAQVTDPDGLDDLVGGKLLSADGSHDFGPFQQVSGGTFVVTTTFGDLDGQESFVFEEMTTRTLLAEFTDASAKTGGATLDLGVACPDAGSGICGDGECQSITDDPANCGTCGNACTGDQSCSGGACSDQPPMPGFTPCFLHQSSAWATCDDRCASLGGCGTACQGADAEVFYTDVGCLTGDPLSSVGSGSCSDILANFGDGWTRCCCLEGG